METSSMNCNITTEAERNKTAYNLPPGKDEEAQRQNITSEETNSKKQTDETTCDRLDGTENDEKNVKQESVEIEATNATEEKNEMKTELELNIAEPTPAGSSAQCSTCSDYMVWDPAIQEHVDVKTEALFARAFFRTTCDDKSLNSDGDSSTQVEDPVSREDQLKNSQRSIELSAQGINNFIVPDENGLIFKGKRPLLRYGCANMDTEKYYKGESKESQNGQCLASILHFPRSMPNTVHYDTDTKPSCTKDNINYKGESKESSRLMANPVHSDTDTEPSCTKYTSNISESANSDNDSDEDTEESTDTQALSEAVIADAHSEPDNDTIPSNEDDNKFKDVVFRLGVRDGNGNDIIVVDAGRLPENKSFNDKKESAEVAKSLSSYIEVFIHSYVDTHNFVVVVHPGNDTRTRMGSSRVGKQLYKMLKNCFSDRLARCIIYKPEFKLRAYVNLVRPFLKREMRSKILFSKSQRNLEQGFGLPIPVIHCL